MIKHTPDMNSEPKKTPIYKRLNVPVLILLVITLTGFTIRAAYIQKTEINTPIRADARQYVIYALNLINHKTFSVEYPSDNPKPDSFRSPGYPAFISLALLFGEEKYYQAIQYLQVVLGTLMIPVTYLLGTAFLPLWGALTAALFVALSPHLVSSASYVLTETLFGTLLTLALLLFCLAMGRARRSLFIISGLFFGLAYLVNEVVLFLPFGLGVILILVTSPESTGKKQKRILKNPFVAGILIFIMVFSLLAGSWMIRNKISIPPGGKSGKGRALITLVHGTYPGFIYKDPRFKYYSYREDPEFEKYTESYSSFARIFLGRFKEKPLRHVTWYLFEKPYYIWSWNIIQGQGDIYIYPVVKSLYQKSSLANSTRILMKILHPIVMILCLGGIIFIIKQLIRGERPDSKVLVLLFAPIIYFTLLYTVFAPLPRYSIPLRPVMYLFAVWTMVMFVDLIREKRASGDSNVSSS